jgi:hypothetical protein
MKKLETALTVILVLDAKRKRIFSIHCTHPFLKIEKATRLICTCQILVIKSLALTNIRLLSKFLSSITLHFRLLHRSSACLVLLAKFFDQPEVGYRMEILRKCCF